MVGNNFPYTEHAQIQKGLGPKPEVAQVINVTIVSNMSVMEEG